MTTTTLDVHIAAPPEHSLTRLAEREYTAPDFDDAAAPTPCLMLADGTGIPLRAAVTTVGRGDDVSVHLDYPGVSRLHAELVRRGPFLYVIDAGLSRNGTFVNGEPVVQALLTDGDVVSFAGVRTRIAGATMPGSRTAAMPAAANSLLSGREVDVLVALCRPAYANAVFVAPQNAMGIAEEMVVTEAAVKQHLLRLYAKFDIPPGLDRRTRLANAVLDGGVVHRQLCLALYGPGAM